MFLLSIGAFFYPIAGFIVTMFWLLMNLNKKCPRNIKYFCLPMALFFAYFGFCMVLPSNDIDLGRYYEQILGMQNWNLASIIQLDSEFLYTKDVLFYFVSRTENVHILPFIVGFVIYLIVFYVLFDMILRSKHTFTIGDLCKLLIIAIGIISPYSIIGNVRCILAYSMISFAVYRDLVQKKRNIITGLIYIIPLGLHASAIIILIFRVLQLVVKRFGMGVVIIAVFLPTLIDFIYPYSNILGDNIIGTLFSLSINKAYAYLFWTEGGWADEIQNSISNKVTRIYGTTFILTLIYMIFKSDKGKIKNSKGNVFMAPMVSYLYIAGACTLGCLYIVTGAFWRFESIVVLFSSIIFVPLLELKNPMINIIYNIVFCSAFMMFFVNIVYMIKNLNIIETIENLFLANGFSVIYYFLNGIMNCLLG